MDLEREKRAKNPERESSSQNNDGSRNYMLKILMLIVQKNYGKVFKAGLSLNAVVVCI